MNRKMRLILKDGTTINDGGAGHAGRTLWLYIPQMTMQDAAALAFDPGKTDTIVHEYGDKQDTYDGFTRCTQLLAGEDGTITIGMEKGES